MLSTARARLSSLFLSEIFANPDQPRKNFDADRLEELAMSIKAYGVQEPIKVVPISQDMAEKFPEGALYMIVMGERRYRASLLAGMEKIPAIIQSLTPDEVEELALLENLQREDLNVMEEAMAFQRGFFDYIPMPVRDITLLTRVARAIAAGRSYAPHRREAAEEGDGAQE